LFAVFTTLVANTCAWQGCTINRCHWATQETLPSEGRVISPWKNGNRFVYI